MNNAGILTWDSLQRNLSDQITVYRALLALLIKENKILINHQVNDLVRLTPEKDDLNNKIHRLKSDYLSLVAQIVIGEPAKSITLERLIELSPQDVQSSLRKQKTELVSMSEGIAQYSHINTKLIEQSMQYVGYMLKKMTEVCLDGQKVYCHRGYSQMLGEESGLLSIVA